MVQCLLRKHHLVQWKTRCHVAYSQLQRGQGVHQALIAGFLEIRGGAHTRTSPLCAWAWSSALSNSSCISVILQCRCVGTLSGLVKDPSLVLGCGSTRKTKAAGHCGGSSGGTPQSYATPAAGLSEGGDGILGGLYLPGAGQTHHCMGGGWHRGPLEPGSPPLTPLPSNQSISHPWF
jgi:hypothetical protein